MNGSETKNIQIFLHTLLLNVTVYPDCSQSAFSMKVKHISVFVPCSAPFCKGKSILHTVLPQTATESEGEVLQKESHKPTNQPFIHPASSKLVCLVNPLLSNLTHILGAGCWYFCVNRRDG